MKNVSTPITPYLFFGWITARHLKVLRIITILRIKFIYRQHSTYLTFSVRNVCLLHVTLMEQKGVLHFKQRQWVVYCPK